MRKTMLVVACVAVAMVMLGGVAWAANIQCPNAHTANGFPICVGTKKADTMRGTDKRDTISGNEGNDTIYGRGLNDHLDGKEGSDKIYGQRGADEIFGQLGSDRLYGGPGSDSVGKGPAAFPQDTSDDYLHGGAGEDRLASQGKSGVDHLYGEDGNDVIGVSQRQSPHNLPVSKEIVDCGPGLDNVTYDEGVDIVDATICEELHPF